MESTLVRTLATLVATAALAAGAGAQTDPLQSRDVAFNHLDSGWVANTGQSADVVAAFHVITPGAQWMRLSFSELDLAGNASLGNGATLKITSMQDGYFQVLNATSAKQWRNTSAYFNGDNLLVELIAHPGTGASRVTLEKATIDDSIFNEGGIIESQCGPTDDRVPSNDPFNARLMPIGCTAWILDDVCGCFGTAGHCMTGGNVVQFNVPLSNSNGTVNNPPPQDQYTVDTASRQWVNGGVGNDWAYFGVFPNSNTGLKPKEAMGGTYKLASVAPPFTGNDSIRITGYGVDSGTANQTQQTHAGPWDSKTSTTLRYKADTQGGNSGSPVFHEETGEVIGVHTHAGCSTSGSGANQGTSRDNNGWGNALNSPLGVCDAACPATSITFMNGSGSNPSCLMTTATPIIGGQWDISIDTSVLPGATFSALRVYRQSTSGIFVGAGEILVDTNSSFLATSNLPASGGTDIHTIDIPNSQSLAGTTLAVQGGVGIGSVVQTLCNAELIILGCSTD